MATIEATTDDLVHFIEGQSYAPASGEFLNKANPRTGEIIGRVARGTAADVNAAVESAAAAFPAWRDRRPIERGRIMMEIARTVRAKSAELGAVEALEAGKPGWMAPYEMEFVAQYFEFYGGLVNLGGGDVIDLGAKYHSYTRREPFGVIGAILPWNAPLGQAARAIAPAIAAGNTVVAKPSEETSGTLVRLAQICIDCGLPAGVINVVLGTGPETGSAIVEHPKVAKVAFTGSVRAGREVGRIAAERVIPLTLELGGKSANIVFEDADLAAAVPGSMLAFALNAGQVCLAGTRLLVQKSILEEFVEGLTKAVAGLKVGPEDDAFVGAITTKAQYERVLSYFEIAKQDGARATTGGAPYTDTHQTGWYVPPTVYVDATPDMRIAREEIFGPVVTVLPFEDEADAIRIANDSEYGLAAGIWTQNLGRAHRVASALEAGQIYVNEYQAGGVETPMGGYKQSGYGREKGVEALHHYTQLKCITIKL